MRLWSPDDGVRRVLVVTAHPDDVDFGAAGTVATLTDAGVDVAYCLVTDGQAGGSDRSISRSEMVEIRHREQRAAAAVVGVSDVTFLGHPDGSLYSTIEVRRDISRVIRQHRPELVITQSPVRDFTRIFASHPDHLAAGEAALCAVYPDSRNPFAHPELLEEGLEPHTVADVWLMAAPESDLAVETTKGFDRKVAALACHESQGGGAPEIADRLRQWGRVGAAGVGLPEAAVAETFRAVTTG